jgi:hypothetical protein
MDAAAEPGLQVLHGQFAQHDAARFEFGVGALLQQALRLLDFRLPLLLQELLVVRYEVGEVQGTVTVPGRCGGVNRRERSLARVRQA